MKTAIILLAILATVVPANALLIDRGSMVYDQDTNLTWIKDANLPKTTGFQSQLPYSVQWGLGALGLMSFNEATAWASDLSYGGYSDWRLPVGSLEGMNFNSQNTEYGHLYYSEGISLANPSPILDLQAPSPPGRRDIWAAYWTGTVDPRYPTTNAFAFWFTDGGEVSAAPLDGSAGGYNWIMVCRDGDVGESITPIPESSTILLLSAGLWGIVYFRKQAKSFLT